MAAATTAIAIGSAALSAGTGLAGYLSQGKQARKYQEQIQTYLPDLASAEVDIIEKERVIKFYIAINQITYTLILDTATKTLSSL